MILTEILTSYDINIKTPARICLFGDHQDYLGLPVIACAIDRYIYLKARKNNTGNFNISLPDINDFLRINIAETTTAYVPGDFFVPGLNVLRRYGYFPNSGFDVEISGNIPINAGVSSSSAMVVAWIHFLMKAFAPKNDITASRIGQLAYEAEVLEQQSPGGRMDQYTISSGKIVFIDTSKDSTIKRLGSFLPGLILAESGISKDTIGLLGNIRSKVTEAINKVAAHFTDFDLMQANSSDIARFSVVLNNDLKPFFFAAIANHDITLKALREFEKGDPNLKSLGWLMNQHHQILRDLLKITVPQIDRMIESALDAGALGAKIVGSGGGGSIVVLAPLHEQTRIIETLLINGARDAYPVLISTGSQSIL